MARRIGLVAGPAAALVIQLLPIPEGLSREAWIVVSLAAVMAVWWATEAIPIPVTSLLPLIVLPLTGAVPMSEAAPRYAQPIIFLLLGGFIIAMAIEKWGLHARIALNIAVRFGSRPALLMLGFMVAAGALSMWISNSATVIMLTPIAIRVAAEAEEDGAAGAGFATALLLGLAWAGSIGGLGTPVGTPTNLLVMAWLEETGRAVGFAQWMLLGVPVACAMIPLAWLVLARGVRAGENAEGAAETVRAHLADLGPVTRPERRLMMAFGAIAFAWMFREFLDEIPGLALLSDTLIAVAGAVALFLIAAGDGKGSALLDWDTAVRLPWGVILLFGGGLSLAWAIESTGLALYLGEGMAAIGAWPVFFLIAALVALVIFFTELMSNVATVSALLPVFGALAAASGADPVLIAAPVAMAASCAFMLPVATGPNAVVFASGRVPIAQMVRTGLIVNLIGVAVISVLVYLIQPLVFG